MEAGMTATTRRSTAAVVHAVHPRFDPPDTTNFSIFTAPASGEAITAVTVSRARTAALVIGRRKGQVSSPPFRNLIHVYAIMPSSERALGLSANVRGSLGTSCNSAATECVVNAISV